MGGVSLLSTEKWGGEGWIRCGKAEKKGKYWFILLKIGKTKEETAGILRERAGIAKNGNRNLRDFDREPGEEYPTIQAKYQKGIRLGKNRKSIVDKCPHREYNPVLLLNKTVYYSFGGCIYE